LVVGEPGIGKSRLLYEFRRWLGDQATWLEGRCISFGRSIALHPVIDMMKRNFRIEEDDDAATIAAKVEQGVLLLGEDLRPLVPYMRYLLSVDSGDPAVLAMDPNSGAPRSSTASVGFWYGPPKCGHRSWSSRTSIGSMRRPREVCSTVPTAFPAAASSRSLPTDPGTRTRSASAPITPGSP
jgi:hypothetical protein